MSKAKGRFGPLRGGQWVSGARRREGITSVTVIIVLMEPQNSLLLKLVVCSTVAVATAVTVALAWPRSAQEVPKEDERADGAGDGAQEKALGRPLSRHTDGNDQSTGRAMTGDMADDDDDDEMPPLLDAANEFYAASAQKEARADGVEGARVHAAIPFRIYQYESEDEESVSARMRMENGELHFDGDVRVSDPQVRGVEGPDWARSRFANERALTDADEANKLLIYTMTLGVDALRMLLEKRARRPNGDLASYRSGRDGEIDVNVVCNPFRDYHSLRFAIHLRSAEMASLLLEYGADASVKDKCGLTALHACSESGDIECVKAILSAVRLREDWRDSVVNARSDTGPAGIGETPIFAAVAEGHIEVVRALIEAGARCDISETKDGNSLLHYAATRDEEEDLGHDPSELKKRLERDEAEAPNLIKLLVENGADVNAKNSHGETPIHWCCDNPHCQNAARTLLYYGSDPNAMSMSGRPLIWGIENELADMVILLVAWGCDVAGDDVSEATATSPIHRILSDISAGSSSGTTVDEDESHAERRPSIDRRNKREYIRCCERLLDERSRRDDLLDVCRLHEGGISRTGLLRWLAWNGNLSTAAREREVKAITDNIVAMTLNLK